MELFAIAHEYGHHDLDHGRGLEGDPHKEEFDADQFALKVCYEIERVPFIFSNPYLASGAGGVVLLLALETLRAVESLFIVNVRDGFSHPDVFSRIGRFDSVAVLKPDEFRVLKSFRTVGQRIMATVHELLISSLGSVPSSARAELTQVLQK